MHCAFLNFDLPEIYIDPSVYPLTLSYIEEEYRPSVSFHRREIIYLRYFIIYESMNLMGFKSPVLVQHRSLNNF